MPNFRWFLISNCLLNAGCVNCGAVVEANNSFSDVKGAQSPRSFALGQNVHCAEIMN